jgi:hypothetical protein
VTAQSRGRLEAPAVEHQIARDMARRALPALPVLVAVSWAVWGRPGALSSAFALALVVGNFAVAAVLQAWAARVSLGLLTATVLFGYILRLGIVSVAVLVVKDRAWVDVVPLGLTLIVAHLGLLFWETRHVSASLAFPGLKPSGS